jgi:hypothetical protein
MNDLLVRGARLPAKPGAPPWTNLPFAGLPLPIAGHVAVETGSA